VGEPPDRRYITTHRFKPLLKRARLPQIRFHDLRHTCATLLLTKNVNPKIVSEMLGHATIAITLDTYSHVLPTMQESAAKAMEERFRSLLLPYCCQSPRWRHQGLLFWARIFAAFAGVLRSCRRWDSNPHDLAATGF
jgi:hypothetical protein